MKPIKDMTQLELAAYVQTHLINEGITVVLSGGACVSLYSDDRYVSKDVDLVNVNLARRPLLRSVMAKIGFQQDGRHFAHPDSPHIIEFPDGPLSVGEEPVKEIQELHLATGILRVRSPSDCVKDRLCAYYFWSDLQALEQAVLVAQINPVDLLEIGRWSRREEKEQEFEVFQSKVLRE
jgi:hypothetical protein